MTHRSSEPIHSLSHTQCLLMSVGESRVLVKAALAAVGVVGAVAGIWYIWNKKEQGKGDKDSNGVRYRLATKADLDKLVLLPIGEQWNPGCESLDGSLIDLLGPSSIMIGELNGEIVSSLIGHKHGEHYGWIGLYICKKELRGKNIGYTTWKRCMQECLKGCDRLSLDGVPERQADYRKSGFGIMTWNTVRYGGTVKGLASGVIDEKYEHNLVHIGKDAPVLIKECVDYDSHVYTEIHRENFMKKWLTMSKNKVVACVDEVGNILGFGAIRPAYSGFRIGPLMADSQEIAQAIVIELGKTISRQYDGKKDKEGVYAEVVDTNKGSVELFRSFDFKELMPCGRMYTSLPPYIDEKKNFVVTNWEFTF
jgi:hypothetical protein